jgi:hypothetical protein
VQRKFSIVITVLFIFAAVNPSTVFAASYLPASLYHKEQSAETVMKAGQTVYLFHSGTEDMRRTIQTNDILVVYRISPLCDVQTVGIIKVVSHIADIYFKAEVVEGEIRPNDIAKKGTVSCLVISAGLCNP